MEERIKAALAELLDGIERRDAQAVQSRMALLDELLARGRPDLDLRLVHFLENRSYPKALVLLGGETAVPGGSCGGR